MSTGLAGKGPAGKTGPAAGGRVMVYRLGSLGDTIVALPCFHRVAEVYPDAERIALTNVPVHAKAAPLEAILGGSGLVHRFVDYPLGLRSPGALWRLRRRIRDLDAHTLVYLTPARGRAVAWRDLLFFKLCGIRQVVGAPLTRSLQRNLPQGGGAVERECARLARCLAPIGVPSLAARTNWDLRLTAAERVEAAALTLPLAGAPSLVINMGGKAARNDWGMDHWTALAARLGARLPGWGLMVVGGPEDRPRSEEIAAVWPGVTLDLAGRCSPRVSAAAMGAARAFVGHDSGPLHLAACVGLPCVGLFGDNNPPGKWHPPGPAHRSLHRIDGVRANRVDEVERATLEVLGLAAPVAAAPEDVASQVSLALAAGDAPGIAPVWPRSEGAA